MMEAEIGVLCFEDGRRYHKPGQTGGCWKLEKARKRIVPWSFHRQCGPTDTQGLMRVPCDQLNGLEMVLHSTHMSPGSE